MEGGGERCLWDGSIRTNISSALSRAGKRCRRDWRTKAGPEQRRLRFIIPAVVNQLDLCETEASPPVPLNHKHVYINR